MAGALLQSVLAQHVPQPAWRLWYARAEISAEISNSVLSITYTDKLEQAAAEIEVTVEDRDRRWQATPPTKGDLLQLSIGYDDPLTPCGLFQIDECDLKGPPDVFGFRGIGATITPDLRTRFSRGYEGQTLLQIATSVAAAHQLEVVGLPATRDVSVARITQKHESDLQFLRRVANLYNYTFTVKGNQLVFTARTHLERAPSVSAITRSVCTAFSFLSKTQSIYKAATVAYLNPATKQLVTATATADPPPTGDTLKLPIRAENAQDAQAKADAALHGHNKDETTGTATTIGNPLYMAGMNVDVVGFGAFDGQYEIEHAVHKLVRKGGYTTDVEKMRRL